jgi:hypothetical protein
VRLSLELTTGFADPRRDETGRGHPSLKPLCLGAPCSHQRTWADRDGAKPHQRSVSFLLPSPPDLWFSRWSVSSQRAACSLSTPWIPRKSEGTKWRHLQCALQFSQVHPRKRPGVIIPSKSNCISSNSHPATNLGAPYLAAFGEMWESSCSPPVDLPA